MRILICEDDSVMRGEIVTAFVKAGYTMEECARAMKALADAFAPPKNVTLILNGLRISPPGHFNLSELCCLDLNHPDGWYRKFSDSCAYDAHLNFNTRYRVQCALESRQMSVLAFRVNNDNNARSLSSHRSPV